MKHLKIKSKIIIMVMTISIISLSLFLAATQYTVKKEAGNSINAINLLKDEASATSEEGLKAQASRYLRRLVSSQAANSNYVFKTIEAQITIATDFVEELWRNPNSANSSSYKKLTVTKDNPNLDFYYSLAPRVNERKVEKDIKTLGKLNTLFRSIVSNNKSMDILPLSVDGVYIGSESGVFFNMTWLAYYNKTYDARKRPWYMEAKAKKEIAWSEMYVDVASNDYTLTCYSPTYNNGKLKGVIGIDVTLNAMLDILSTQVKDIGEVFITDNTGKVLTYTKLSDELQKTIGESQNISKSSNKELQSLAAKIAGEKEGVFELEVNNVSRIAAYSPIESTSWNIVVVAFTDEIMSYVNKSRGEIDKAGQIMTEYSKKSFQNSLRTIILIFIVVIIIVVFISSKFASFIVKPILKLTDGVSKLGNGDLDSKIEINTKDELEVLANTYNKMTGDLKTYIHDLKETTAAKERIEGELQVANKIQASMLPRIFPPFPDRTDISIFGSMQPAKNVGGDYFDFFFINENKFCFTVGDVSGKGVPASLFMVISKVLVKNEALRNIPAHEIFNSANNMLCEDNDEFLFTTSIVFIIDLQTGAIEYANAGHNPPLIYRASEGKFSYMELKKGFVLGGMSGFEYALEQDKLEEGDIVFTYTDGVTEAMDPDNNQYSEVRLLNKLNSIESKNVNDIEKIIKEDIIKFVNGAEQSDDITMLIFKYEGNK